MMEYDVLLTPAYHEQGDVPLWVPAQLWASLLDAVERVEPCLRRSHWSRPEAAKVVDILRVALLTPRKPTLADRFALKPPAPDALHDAANRAQVESILALFGQGRGVVACKTLSRKHRAVPQ
jgi:hypothetical protein